MLVVNIMKGDVVMCILREGELGAFSVLLTHDWMGIDRRAK